MSAVTTFGTSSDALCAFSQAVNTMQPTKAARIILRQFIADGLIWSLTTIETMCYYIDGGKLLFNCHQMDAQGAHLILSYPQDVQDAHLMIFYL